MPVPRTRPTPLPATFFEGPAEEVAKNLLGTLLVREWQGGRLALRVTETEAYIGPEDRASHAARGRTKRTEVMFGPPGTLYVYLIYGLHWMLNVVTGEAGYPAAVLIRSAGDAGGPGVLARRLFVTDALNGKPASPGAGLWFEASGDPPPRRRATARIGVAYAGPRWSRRKLRFVCV